MTAQDQIGIDLGGTKISAIRLGYGGDIKTQMRVDTPRGDYGRTIQEICALVRSLADQGEDNVTVGVGIPGSISPRSGLVQNANSTWLNGKPLKPDLEEALGRPVRIANDANCFAISEAVDGAGKSSNSVFGVILGTGCGGGFAFRKRIIDGPRAIGGEWGHTPLPSPEPDEMPGPACWCGRHGCIETWVSGPGLTADHRRNFGKHILAADIYKGARDGCNECSLSLERHASRLARGLAVIVNILDPDCVVLGGGLSKMAHLYDRLPALIAPHIFAEAKDVRILPPRHGDDSGVRGAAWLWDGHSDPQ